MGTLVAASLNNLFLAVEKGMILSMLRVIFIELKAWWASTWLAPRVALKDDRFILIV